MIIEDVKLIDTLDVPKSAPYHLSRVFKITTDNGTVHTPHKTTNRLEYNARGGLPLLKILPDGITTDFKLLDSQKINGFLNNSKKALQLINTVKQFNDITRRSALRISIFQPTNNVLKNWTKHQKIKFAEIQAEFLQSKLDSNLITYPFLDLGFSDYVEFIDRHYVRNEHQSTIFTFDMGMNPTYLKKLLDHMQSKEDPMIIALIHKPWINTIPQHIILNSYFNNEKMVFFGCQVKRKDDDSNTSNTHAIAIGSNFDIVALEQSRGFPTKQNLTLNKINFFSPISLLIDTIENTLNDPSRDILKELNIPSDNHLDLIHVNRILKGYKGAKIHPKKYQILFYLARVHEAITSPLIFTNTIKNILERNILQHINETSLQEIPMIKG